MKIVLVNYRYFVSGGPERYMFNIKNVLENYGHTVIPFSIKNSRNEPSEYENFFLDSVDDVYFAQSKKSLKLIFKSFFRMVYSFEAKKKFKALLKQEHPDLIYIIQYHNKISPSVIDVARSIKIPVIHRISDFQYMCPNALFYNDKKGVCEDCLNHKVTSCIKYKCVLNSRVYSLIKTLAKCLHDILNVKDKIDAFVVPSSFTLQKLKQYGIAQSKLYHIPTFFNITENNPNVTYEPFFLYVGRIEKQKGLMTLVKSFVDTDYNLKIIGFSSDGYEDDIKAFLKGKKHNIEFLGKMDFEQIKEYLKSCLCTIVPSEWYDNFPNSILESFAYKKAVIATDFGSLTELVKNNDTGLTFKYADFCCLKEKLKYMLNNRTECIKMGENAFEILKKSYSPEVHYNSLIKIMNSITQND